MAANSPIIEAFSVSHAQILKSGQSFIDALIAQYNEGTDVYGVNSASLEPDTGDYDNEGDDTILSTWSWINKGNVSVQAGYLSFPLISELSGRPLEQIATRTATNAVQTIKALTGATAGTFTLSYGGATTAPIAYNAVAAAITTALTALPSIGSGNITSTGGPLPTADVVVTFNGIFAGRAVLPISINTSALTGGPTTPVIQQTTGGAPAFKGGVAADLWHEDDMNLPARPMIIKMPSKLHTGEPADFVYGLNKVQFKPIAFDGPAYKDGLKVNYNGTALASLTDEQGFAYPDGKKRFGKLLSIIR